MFCFQCEQTANGSGCTKVGVCGKSNDCAMLQDVLIHQTECLAFYLKRIEENGGFPDISQNRFVTEALFATITNVDFSQESIAELIGKAVRYSLSAREEYRKQIGAGKTEKQLPCDMLENMLSIPDLLKYAEKLSIAGKLERDGKTVAGLREFLLHGVKGICAYTDHAAVLGHTDDVLYSRINGALDSLLAEPKDPGFLLNLAMEIGQTSLRSMELLNTANTGTYGHPEPTSVRVTPVKGKAILVSGHDLRDLDLILQATEGKDIHVYTHGEMLPCNAYPFLKKYPHLIGNYGGAWQDQKKEFAAFPGAILMTTNCIVPPAESYKNRIFTTGLVRYPDVMNIADKDFSPVIEAALREPGFTEDAPEKRIPVGFAVDTAVSFLPEILGAVRKGLVRHFFLIGGCDGARSGRNYYTRLAEMIPEDCVILTLACGKYRFNKMDFGKIGVLPRLLDCGQCNDAWSAIQIAITLADKLNCTVNELPLSLVLSWYEQKAVAVLLALLSLDIRNIKIGPTLPASLSPEVLGILHEKFAISPVSDPEKDLADMLK